MLDEKTAAVAGEMAEALRKSAVGTLFVENRNYVIIGVFFSLITLGLVARPWGRDEWLALILGLGIMAPGAFYLVFLALRIRDVCLSVREKWQASVIRRGAIVLLLAVPSVAAITMGSVVLTTTFGWPTIAAAVLLTGLTLWFSQHVKAPTAVGRVRLDQIEGFRMFLQSVERLPLDREDCPSDHTGVYERDLPYAVALES